MTKQIIKSAFRQTRIYLLSCKAGLTIVRKYQKKTPSDIDSQPEYPKFTLNSFFKYKRRMQEFINQGGPAEFSSPSKVRFIKTLTSGKSYM